MRRGERTDNERAVALTCYWLADTPKERLAEWIRQTGKSRPAFYRRLKEALTDTTRLRREYPSCDDAWRVWRDRQREAEYRRQFGEWGQRDPTHIPERED